MSYIRKVSQFHVLDLMTYTLAYSRGCGEVTICTWTGFDHGQILIESATHSLEDDDKIYT